MAAKKRHKSILDEKLKGEIDEVLGKLKCPRSYRQVQNWLENFELAEVELALNFLLFFDYITFEDLQCRLEPFVIQIAAASGDNNVLFVPYGNYVKSNDLIMYAINKSAIFRRHYKKKRFHYTRDILELSLESPTIIVFVDDFVGSGKSFLKWYKRQLFQSWLKKNSKNVADQYLLCAEIMSEGKDNISKAYSQINVLGNLRNKIFKKSSSPFQAIGKLKEMEKLGLKYGAMIPVSVSFPNTLVYTPRGYDDSEAHLAFDYGTPNNTLPIIWGAHNWQPIFPRVGKQRILMVEQVKRDAWQFLGIAKRLGFTINQDLKVETGGKPILFTFQEDLGLLTFLILRMQNRSVAEISQIVGVQIQILEKIIKSGRQKDLVDNINNVTEVGKKFVEEIRKQSHKFREKDDLSDKSKILFVPSTFDNTT